MKASQGKKLTLKEAGEKFGYTLTDYEWDYKRKFVELRK